MKKDLIQIKNVPELVEKLTGIKRSRTTVYQWIKVGRVIYGGDIIKLKTIKRLGFLFTTRKYIEEFLEKL